MNEANVCPKCGFKKLTKNGTYRLETKYSVNLIFVTAYICGNCGYVELYKEKS
jgi:predicted nucleic-acid-binding Zn-ribbon protein